MRATIKISTCLVLLYFIVAVLLGAASDASAESKHRRWSDIIDAASAADGQVLAGVSSMDSTLNGGVGVPIAGYNHGKRRVKGWPVPKFTKYTAFMSPSEGALMPLFTKCVVIIASGEKACICTIDAIGSDSEIAMRAHQIAVGQGFSVPFDNFILSASHTHSGPGAISQKLLWEMAPATDIFRPALFEQMANYIASAMVSAERQARPVRLGIGRVDLIGATRNRRAGYSPYVTRDSIDKDLAIIRIDDLEGKPLGTLWNFAIHGTCYGPDAMLMTGDVMGQTNLLIEREVGGISVFVNSDAGDIAPAQCGPLENIPTANVIAKAVAEARPTISTVTTLQLQASSVSLDFGKTHMNLTAQRLTNCTEQGISLCNICSSKFLNCHADLQLGSKWIDTVPRFTALRFIIEGKSTVFVTVPGEAISELGAHIKNDAYKLGFDQAFVFGFSQTHMGYFVTPREYIVGGYESILTLWGINTANKVREGTSSAMKPLAPRRKQ